MAFTISNAFSKYSINTGSDIIQAKNCRYRIRQSLSSSPIGDAGCSMAELSCFSSASFCCCWIIILFSNFDLGISFWLGEAVVVVVKSLHEADDTGPRDC